MEIFTKPYMQWNLLDGIFVSMAGLILSLLLYGLAHIAFHFWVRHLASKINKNK